MTGRADAVSAPVLPSWNRRHSSASRSGQVPGDAVALEAQRDDRTDEDHRHHEAEDEDDVDARHRSAAEAPVARRQGEAEDDDDVGDALDEDRADRPRRRGAVVRLQQVRAVEVAELGRHEAVDEPRQVEDLERVEEADARADLGEDVAPAEGTDREGQVVGDEGERQVADVGAEHELPGGLDVDAQRVEGEDQQDDREDDRSDRAPVEDPPRQADLALGDRLVGGRIQELTGLVERAALV